MCSGILAWPICFWYRVVWTVALKMVEWTDVVIAALEALCWSVLMDV